MKSIKKIAARGVLTASLMLGSVIVGASEASAADAYVPCPPDYYRCLTANTAHGNLVMWTRLGSDHHEYANYRAAGWQGDKVWMNWTKDNGKTWYEETEVTDWIGATDILVHDYSDVWDGSPYKVQVCTADAFGNWLPNCTPWH
ncbi:MULTISPECIES: hypothetical protein [unclassified Streptomyces]|uniref:hypothetical protein n=1 Tax=unclassified Streptomyces TaxID=2593676 RepID=UPI0034150E6B